MVEFCSDAIPDGLDIYPPLPDFFQGLVFPGQAFARRFCKYVPLKFAGDRRLKEPLIAGLDAPDGVQQLEQIFSRELVGMFAGGEFWYEVQLFEGRFLLESPVN